MNLKTPVFDYDKIEEWSPWIDDALGAFNLGSLTPPPANIKYIEDARNVVVEHFGKSELSRILFGAFGKYGVRFFHGTRVNDAELDQIRNGGLQPLNLPGRRNRLIEILSRHPDWTAATEGRLDNELHNYGPNWKRMGMATEKMVAYISAVHARAFYTAATTTSRQVRK